MSDDNTDLSFCLFGCVLEPTVVLLTVSSGDHTLCSATSCWVTFPWQLFTEQYSDTVYMLIHNTTCNNMNWQNHRRSVLKSNIPSSVDRWENLKRWSCLHNSYYSKSITLKHIYKTKRGKHFWIVLKRVKHVKKSESKNKQSE